VLRKFCISKQSSNEDKITALESIQTLIEEVSSPSFVFRSGLPAYLAITATYLNSSLSTAELFEEAYRVLQVHIDMQEVAAYFGTKHDTISREDTQVDLLMKARRKCLLSALSNLCRAYQLCSKTVGFEWTRPLEVYSILKQWADLTTPEYLSLYVAYESQLGNLGECLAQLNKALGRDLLSKQRSRQQKQLYKTRIQLLDQLGWINWAQYERDWMLLRFPSSFLLL